MTFKEMVTKVKDKLLLIPAMLTIALSKTVTAHADTLWDNGTTADNGIAALVDNISKLYRKWSLPFILIGLILCAVTKDEKKREIEKRAVIIMILVYVVTYMYSLITGSIDAIGSAFDTTTTTP